MLMRWDSARLIALAALAAAIALAGCSQPVEPIFISDPLPGPYPDPATAPNVVASVHQAGPVAAEGSLDGEHLLAVKSLGAGLYPAGSPTAALLQQSSFFSPEDAVFTHVPPGNYAVQLFYWQVTPSHSYPEQTGVPGLALPGGPQAAVTITGSEIDVPVALEFNPTGTGPYGAVSGVVQITGNPVAGEKIQLVFIPLDDAPGQAPASAFVRELSIGESDDCRCEFSVEDLQQGRYLLGFAGPGLRNRDADDYEPARLDVTAAVEGLQVRIRNNWGNRPSGLGQISGTLRTDQGWRIAGEPLVVRAVREDYVPATSPGSVGVISIDGYHDQHDEAAWLVTEADGGPGVASFMLGWLNDGNYSIFVSKGSYEYRMPDQVVIKPSDRSIAGLDVDPGFLGT